MKSRILIRISLLSIFITILVFLIYIVIYRKMAIERYDSLSKYYENLEIEKLSSEKKSVYEEIKSGNLVAYFSSEDYSYYKSEIAFNDYHVVAFFYENGDVEKPIMDSVIFQRFGPDFYHKIQIKV